MWWCNLFIYYYYMRTLALPFIYIIIIRLLFVSAFRTRKKSVSRASVYIRLINNIKYLSSDSAASPSIPLPFHSSPRARLIGAVARAAVPESSGLMTADQKYYRTRVLRISTRAYDYVIISGPSRELAVVHNIMVQ